MEGGGGARAWPQVAGVGGHLLGSACVPGSLAHHLVFTVTLSPLGPCHHFSLAITAQGKSDELVP